MSEYQSVLGAAWQLSPEDRMRLLDALWEAVPADADLPLHEDWAPELERRVAMIEAGDATATPWAVVRQEALARIGHGAAG